MAGEYSYFDNFIDLLSLKDGQDGQDGQPGANGKEYYVAKSSEQILKFYDSDGTLYFSPSWPSFALWQKDESGEYKVKSLEEYSVKISYNTINLEDINFVEPLPDSNGFQLNLGALLSFQEDNEELAEAVGYIKENNVFLDLEFYKEEHNKKIIIFKDAWPVQFGTSQSMARFNILAGKITATVDGGAIDFDGASLNVIGAGLSIWDSKKEEQLLKYDQASKSLSIKGSGSFTGNIEADSGYFKGDITGASGTFSGNIEADSGYFKGDITGATGKIGGFSISDGKLASKGEEIILYGKEGKIEANNINLGTGATIKKYIEIGEAKIWNPNESQEANLFIEAGQLKLYQNGQINLGKIIMEGENSKIFGTNFSITPELASFSNINCSGVIRTAVFEKGKVQGVGGAMLFKPTFKISNFYQPKGSSQYHIQLDGFGDTDEELFQKGSWVLLAGESGQDTTFTQSRYYLQFDKIENEELVFDYQGTAFDANFNPEVLTILGHVGEAIIGINSQSFSMENILYPEGLTISTLKGNTTQEEAKLNHSLNLFLGNLEGISEAIPSYIDPLKGYGLYCDNVYLRGSLMSVIESESNYIYAGINTESTTSCEIFDDDNSPIIFWGGASSMQNVAKAPFQVTALGSLYAEKAKFKDSIIAGSTITGAKIYTAEIHPHDITDDNTPNYSLRIFSTNASSGILFSHLEEIQEGQTQPDISDIFSINKQGLSIIKKDQNNNDTFNYIIKVEEGKGYFAGSAFSVIESESNSEAVGLKILKTASTEGISMGYGSTETEDFFNFLNFSKEGLKFYSQSSENEGELVIFNMSENTFVKKTQFKSQVNLNDNVIYGDKMKYEKTENGYDLYVS